MGVPNSFPLVTLRNDQNASTGLVHGIALIVEVAVSKLKCLCRSNMRQTDELREWSV
jgi:hypothetical protein